MNCLKIIPWGVETCSTVVCQSLQSGVWWPVLTNTTTKEGPINPLQNSQESMQDGRDYLIYALTLSRTVVTKCTTILNIQNIYVLLTQKISFFFAWTTSNLHVLPSFLQTVSPTCRIWGSRTVIATNPTLLGCDGGSQSDSFRRFERIYCLHIQGPTVREDEDTTTLQNAENSSPNDTASHSTRLTSSIHVSLKRYKF